jgi:hypothetical protein
MQGRALIPMSNKPRLMLHVDQQLVQQRGRLQEYGEIDLPLSRPGPLEGKWWCCPA